MSTELTIYRMAIKVCWLWRWKTKNQDHREVQITHRSKVSWIVSSIHSYVNLLYMTNLVSRTHNQVAYIDSELEDLSIRYTPNHISRTRVASISQPTTFNSLTRSSDNEGFRSLNSYAANTKMSSLHKRSTSVPDNALMSSNVFIRQSYVSRPEVEDANFIVLRLEQET